MGSWVIWASCERQPDGTCFSVVDSRPIGDMKWLTEQFGFAKRELVFEPRDCHLSVVDLTTP